MFKMFCNITIQWINLCFTHQKKDKHYVNINDVIILKNIMKLNSYSMTIEKMESLQKKKELEEKNT